MTKLKKKVFVYFHTHWDREWYKTRVEFTFRLVKVFDDVIEKLKSKELPCFYFDGQTIALKDYLKIRPENKAVVRDMIKSKRLFIGPFLCSTDSFLVSVQSFLSNIDLGVKYSQDFGCNKFIGYCADTFGHSKSLPEIFKYYNFEGGFFWRGLDNIPSNFNWDGLKSVNLRQGYFHDYLNFDLSPKKKAEYIEAQLKKIDDGTKNPLILPLGADHLKVADNPQKQINEINKYLENYELIISNPFEYLASTSATTKISGELRKNTRNFILPGVYSSRIDLKQQNALAQWQLLRLAEPLNALCFNKKLVKNNYQSHIDVAKEELIKNHAHDSIYGCSIDAAHKNMVKRFDEAISTANCVIDEVLNELSKTGKTQIQNINVINLSDFEFSGLAEIKTDTQIKYGQLLKTVFSIDKTLSLDPNKIPVTEDFKNIHTYLIQADNIKPFSIAEIQPQKAETDLKITKNSVENSKIALKISGSKINLTDKKNNKTYKNFIEITDFADVGDSYNFAPVKNDKKIKAEIIGSKIHTKGSLRSILEIKLKIIIPKTSTVKGRSKACATHKLTLLTTLDKNSDFIKFKLNWENKSKNHIMKFGFNLENPITKTISDDMLGIVERHFDPDYKMKTPAPKGIELKINTAPMQSFVSSQGLGIITKGLNEYEIRKNTLEITVLRSTGIISNPKNPSRGTPAGPPINTPDLYMLKKNSVELALCFENDEDKIRACQQAFYGCTFAFFGDIQPQNVISPKFKGQLLTAKISPDKNSLSIRIFDGKKIKAI